MEWGQGRGWGLPSCPTQMLMEHQRSSGEGLLGVPSRAEGMSGCSSPTSSPAPCSLPAAGSLPTPHSGWTDRAWLDSQPAAP